MSDQPRRPVFFWLVLLVCVVYAGLFAFTIYAVARYYGVEKAPGWSIRTDGTSWFVSDVDDAGAAAGHIQLGDRLRGDQWRRALLGDRFVHQKLGFLWTAPKPTVSILIAAANECRSSCRLLLVPGQQLTPIFALVGLAFFICGAALALLSPRRSLRSAWPAHS